MRKRLMYAATALVVLAAGTATAAPAQADTETWDGCTGTVIDIGSPGTITDDFYGTVYEVGQVEQEYLTGCRATRAQWQWNSEWMKLDPNSYVGIGLNSNQNPQQTNQGSNGQQHAHSGPNFLGSWVPIYQGGANTWQVEAEAVINNDGLLPGCGGDAYGNWHDYTTGGNSGTASSPELGCLIPGLSID
jgi:hypothetical protein